VSAEAIPALRRETALALDLFGSLDEREWAAPSGCAGWRVQDVAQHMASTYHTIADPSSIDAGSASRAEENAEVPVQARRDWSPAQVIAEYVEWSERGIAALEALQSPPMRDTVVPLADLGSHPLHLLANAIVFDHYCHLRHDIGVALPRAAAFSRDEGSLRATLEWMLAGLPQMCHAQLSACTQAVNLRFGDVGTVALLRPDGERWTVEAREDPSQPVATTTAHDFVAWGTKRGDWRAAGVELGGPGADAAAATLDAINVI